MFEPHEAGVLAHGDVAEVNPEEAESLLDEVRTFARVEVEKKVVPQENWNAKWEEEYPLVVVHRPDGQLGCTIRAPFMNHRPLVWMVVAPQMSFGTGHHATTHLMTAQLLKLELNGKAVLDMGCGTGVLALVAAKQGATRIHGIDIEQDAVVNAQDNHALNGDVEQASLSFEQGDGACFDDMPNEAWDVLCANIHKNVLMADMSRYARTLKKGGSLLLSGFFEGDAPELQAAAKQEGLVVREVVCRDGRACIVGNLWGDSRAFGSRRFYLRCMMQRLCLALLLLAIVPWVKAQSTTESESVPVFLKDMERKASEVESAEAKWVRRDFSYALEDEATGEARRQQLISTVRFLEGNRTKFSVAVLGYLRGPRCFSREKTGAHGTRGTPKSTTSSKTPKSEKRASPFCRCLRASSRLDCCFSPRPRPGT